MNKGEIDGMRMIAIIIILIITAVLLGLFLDYDDNQKDTHCEAHTVAQDGTTFYKCKRMGCLSGVTGKSMYRLCTMDKRGWRNGTKQ